ncbi:MAG: class I SAM-dependent methyltransferase [Oscillospiraceae bacterium]|nr:class I SAM-dependent methyltransferase [Oscillospiraceae bacterium]
MQIGKWETSKGFEYENGFYMTSQPYRLGNILAHYELYKKITELPGDVIELGVFKGSSLIQFCTFRELLENENSRKIVGFDVFGEFPNAEKVESDTAFVEGWNKQFSSEFPEKEDIERSLQHKKIGNVELVKGNILETVDEYLERNPHTRIALLHIDTDVYEPAKYGLEKLFDRVVKDGVIVFDDYATIEGETLAVEEFFKDRDYKIHKFRFSHTKPSYIIKE